MRKIKFRGMDINGNWYYGLLAYTESTALLPGGKTGWFISNKAGSPWAYHVRPETIGQCTGLKDKNGKLIYEGDIVKFYKLTYEVYFQERNSAIKIWNEKKQIGYSLGYHEEFEVIGNIHENPELLEDK